MGNKLQSNLIYYKYNLIITMYFKLFLDISSMHKGMHYYFCNNFS